MIYVLSDIHGNERRFNSIMEQINLRQEDTLYVLGDVIDRFPGGIRILRQLMSMPNVKMILGNHEYMMLRALGHPRDNHRDDGRAMEHWYRNGGKVTHDQFHQLPADQQQELIAYLHSLPLNIDVVAGTTRYKLVHGSPADGYRLWSGYPSRTYYAVWKRLEDFPVPKDGCTVMFGHTPTAYYQNSYPMEIWRADHYIGIDCGSGYPEDGFGRLACLRLDDGAVFYSKETAE